MISALLPLLSSTAALDAPIAWRGGRPVSRALFLHHVAAVARRLPPARYIFNLCEDRYGFLVAFAAVGVNGQINLLPSSRARLHVQQLAADYPDNRAITDADLERWLDPTPVTTAASAIPELSDEQVIAIAFTSGSTGRASPHPKTWGELVRGAGQTRQRFGFAQTMAIVATVPPQHVYGLETSIMAPLVSGVSIHTGRPFFPADVGVALATVPAPRVLVTTPLHLRACVAAGLRWPAVVFLLSATAPLTADLAAQAEEAFGAPVLEIYGCTETGAIASRRTVVGQRWRLYDGLRLGDGGLFDPQRSAPFVLNDIVEPCGEFEFKLLGRREDLINIAGKRTSLDYLNHQLNQIAGVVEGVFVMPEATGSELRRLMVVVVAPGVSERQLLAALAQRLDPVFLPRPLIKVAALPRNATGKLSREDLLALVDPRQPSTVARHE